MVINEDGSYNPDTFLPGFAVWEESNGPLAEELEDVADEVSDKILDALRNFDLGALTYEDILVLETARRMLMYKDGPPATKQEQIEKLEDGVDSRDDLAIFNSPVLGGGIGPIGPSIKELYLEDPDYTHIFIVSFAAEGGARASVSKMYGLNKTEIVESPVTLNFGAGTLGISASVSMASTNIPLETIMDSGTQVIVTGITVGAAVVAGANQMIVIDHTNGVTYTEPLLEFGFSLGAPISFSSESSFFAFPAK